MRRIIGLIAVFAVLSAGVCLADPSASPVPAVAAAGQTVFQTVWEWIMGHQIALGILVAAILDFLFALNPKWKSNGILHWLYLIARKKAGLPDLPVA